MKRKPIFKVILYSMFALMFLAGCKDIIEPSIANHQILTIAPGDKLQSTNYNLTFSWNDVDDALQYRLQIVSPKFDSVTVLIIDTVIKSSRFTVSLSPGIYQWHVRGENGSSKTAYSVARNFTIVQSSLKPQKVQLNSPANNFLTNQANISFSWSALFGATRYHIQIDTNSFIDTSKLFYSKTIPGQQLAITLSKDQLYQWRIRAESDTAQSQWSVVNNFTYDHTPPPAPLLSLPADKQSVASTVVLQWNNVATAVRYRVYIYKNDGTTLYSSAFPMPISLNSYSFTGASGDTNYWKVTALDVAGNESGASETRSFTLQ